MGNVVRTFFWAVVAILVFTLLMVFLSVVLRVALVVALFALAYYWWVRASETRRRSRNWR